MKILDQWFKSNNATKVFGKTKALYFDAYFKISHYFFFRGEEALRLKFENVQVDQYTSNGTPFDFVTIPFRKTRDVPTTLELHPLSEEPALCAYSALHKWITYIKEECGIIPNESDFIFPMIQSNGILNYGRSMTLSPVLKALKEACKESGLTDSLPKHIDVSWTTHAFRRGGAQHRFMYASYRWSLSDLKNWGGWTEKDHNDIVIKYVMEEVWDFENYYGDMLSPTKNHFRKASFMGDTPPHYNNNEISTTMYLNISSKLSELEEKLSNIETESKKVLFDFEKFIKDIQN
jgi:hypothetical protein